MKVLIILAILVTIAIIFFKYNKEKNLKRLFFSLATFAIIISLAVIGNLARPIMPIFLAHAILIIIAWGTALKYVFTGTYHWWIIFSPILTIILFLVLEFLTGSGHELT